MSATYTVVTLDGQEHSNLDLETVKEWFLKRKLRDDSFVQSSETGEWKLLKKAFDLNQWFSQNFAGNHAPQPQYQQQPPVPQQQQWHQQQTHSQPIQQQQTFHQPVQQQMYHQAMPTPQPQHYAPQHDVNAYYQQQQFHQPQQQWVSEQKWVAPPPPTTNASYGQRVLTAFESASGRAKAASVSLKIILGITAGMMLINVMTIIARPDMEAINEGQMSVSFALIAMASALLAFLYLAAYVVTAILFLMWLHLAYKNLQAFGVKTDDTPGWVVGYWFIPILHLFRPYQKVKELFDKSGSMATQYRVSTQDADSSLVGVWWACYLIAGLISNISFRSSFSASTTDDIIFASVLDIVSDVLSIVAAWLIIKIIKTINDWHESCASTTTQNYYPQTQYGNPMGY